MPSIPWPLVLGIAAAALLLFLLVGALSNGDDPEPGRAVPDGIVGSPVADATTYLEGAGLEIDVVDMASDEPAGTVLASEPAEGEHIENSGTVELLVSSGPGDAPATTQAPPADDDDGGGGRDKPGKGKKDD